MIHSVTVNAKYQPLRGYDIQYDGNFFPQPSSYIRYDEFTFVVHVGGDLNHTETEVDWQVVEVIVGLQNEFSSQLYAVPNLVHLIDQHCIEVLILEMRKESETVMRFHIWLNTPEYLNTGSFPIMDLSACVARVT